MIERWLWLGRANGHHVDGFVDTDVCPTELRPRVVGEAVVAPSESAPNEVVVAGRNRILADLVA
jgi:hypothetical protein